MKEIASQVDLMLVIGAENSSNSKRLVEVARASGAKRAILIADKDQIDWDIVDEAKHIGLSSGASAPEVLVKEVVSALHGRYSIVSNEEIYIEEKINFKLPPNLMN